MHEPVVGETDENIIQETTPTESTTKTQTIITCALAAVIALLATVIVFLLTSPPQTTVVQKTSEESPAIETKIVTTELPVSDPEQKPNVLLIILDDIGLDYFPGFLVEEGFEKANMPVMESLMQDGYRFTNLNTYAMCSPTRASLLTGHHGVDTGVLDPGRTAYLDPRWQSIQKEISLLSNGEIASAVFGKWHLLGREGDITHPNEFVDHYSGIPTGNHESYFTWDKVVDGVPETSNTYATTDFTDDAIEWINKQDSQWYTI